MKQLFLNSLFSFFVILNGQVSPFKSYDVVIYPEYYFSGVMAEIEGEILPDNLPLDLQFLAPSNTDSVFYVGGNSENPTIETLKVFNKGSKKYINKELNESRFRIFVFYGIDKKGTNRSSGFEFEVNHSIDDAHIVVQQPLVAENFIFSDDPSENFTDQHGINFKRIHLNNYKKNSIKTVTFSYDNPSQDISINSLQKDLSTAPSQSPQASSKPIRHKLPLWQPLVVLGVVSVVVSSSFYFNSKREGSEDITKPSKGKFCTKCGEKIKKDDKFCSNCGERL